ncbi:LigA [Parafrankia sp. EUN1f]|nr:LigA [Parafrankia sp. EUN1f]
MREATRGDGLGASPAPRLGSTSPRSAPGDESHRDRDGPVRARNRPACDGGGDAAGTSWGDAVCTGAAAGKAAGRRHRPRPTQAEDGRRRHRAGTTNAGALVPDSRGRRRGIGPTPDRQEGARAGPAPPGPRRGCAALAASPAPHLGGHAAKAAAMWVPPPPAGSSHNYVAKPTRSKAPAIRRPVSARSPDAEAQSRIVQGLTVRLRAGGVGRAPVAAARAHRRRVRPARHRALSPAGHVGVHWPPRSSEGQRDAPTTNIALAPATSWLCSDASSSGAARARTPHWPSSAASPSATPPGHAPPNWPTPCPRPGRLRRHHGHGAARLAVNRRSRHTTAEVTSDRRPRHRYVHGQMPAPPVPAARGVHPGAVRLQQAGQDPECQAGQTG